MRGHWESQTRKLNKHYQSGNGGGGITPPPPEWVWQKFMAGGCAPPFKFTHDPDWDNQFACTDAIYYNRLVNSFQSSVMDYNYDNANFARVDLKIGPVSPRYDGMIKGYRRSYVPGSTQWGDRWYEQQVGLKERAGIDPDAVSSPGSYYDGSSAVSAAARDLYYDLGWRFVKWRLPSYTSGPAYFTGAVGQHNNNVKLAETEVIKSDIRLSARACKAMAWEYNVTPGRRQTIDLRKPGSTTNYQIFNEYDTDINIYDLELVGQSYVERTNFYINGVPYTVRVFCFIHDGEYYVDLLPHFYDSVTGIEDTTLLGSYWVRVMRFPAILMGFCYMDPPYSKPNADWAPEETVQYGSWRVSGNPVAESIVCADFQQDEALMMTIGTTEVWTEIQLKCKDNGFIPIQLTAEDFWSSESDWHDINGGIPYPYTP